MAYEQLTCLCIICPAFVVIETLFWENNKEMMFWSCTEVWILLVFDIPSLFCSLQFFQWWRLNPAYVRAIMTAIRQGYWHTCMKKTEKFKMIHTHFECYLFISIIDYRNSKVGKFFLKCILFLQNMILNRATRSIS